MPTYDVGDGERAFEIVLIGSSGNMTGGEVRVLRRL
jgi:hypothetical protein